jgi:hypothetical protein
LFKGQLFNLKKDLREANNVYNKYSEKVAELKALLEANK